MKSTLILLVFSFTLLNTAISQTCNYTISATPDTLLCEPGAVQLQAIITGQIPSTPTYQWFPATGLNNASIPNPIATVTNTQTYNLQVSALDTVNLVTNGGFENGTAGFTTAYPVGTGGTYGLLSTDGTYAIASNPNLTHTNFASCNDHTPAPGVNMMVVNGSVIANTNIWCQTISVTPNTTYIFEMWGISTVGSGPANLRIRFNNVAASNTFQFPLATCSWQQYTTSWYSGNSNSVTICISNIVLAGPGNDFAIDDISLFEICQKTASVTLQRAAIAVTNIDTSICQGENIFLGGALQTMANTYYDTLTNMSGCDSIIATQLTIQQPPKPFLGEDTTLCGTDLYTLSSADTSNVAYLWSDNSTNSSLAVNIAGDYSLQVTDTDGCTNSDTVQINYNPYPILNLGNDTTLCTGDERVLRATQSQGLPAYIWHDGSTSGTYVVQEPGDTYSVMVTLDNCSASDEVTIDYDFCNCNVGIPNAITPNGDGRNDNFHALYQLGCSFTSFNLKIFNRWGKLIYQSNDIDNGWDGTIDGKSQPQDSYLYVVEYTLDEKFNEAPTQKAGSFLLIR